MTHEIEFDVGGCQHVLESRRVKSEHRDAPECLLKKRALKGLDLPKTLRSAQTRGSENFNPLRSRWSSLEIIWTSSSLSFRERGRNPPPSTSSSSRYPEVVLVGEK